MKRRFFLHIALLLITAQHATVNGFGKNKVQYLDFSWRYIDTPHFQVYYHQDQGDLPEISAHWIERSYAWLSKDFKFKHRKKIPLIPYGSPNLFQQTNVILEVLPEGVGGFTELFKNRIVVPFTGSYEEFRHVLHHELVHAFQFGILYDQFGSAFMRSSNIQMPIWFAEGSAEFLSSGWDSKADMFMMDRTIFSVVPNPGPRLGGYMAYKGGQSFLYFLAATRGDKKFLRFLRAFRESKNVESSIRDT
ncbi:MAG: biopolymer transporter Tol, partial [Chitinivibrionales bacterium]|nr:biopolymer transporter Tol [Chitinivibrionales bacterium]